MRWLWTLAAVLCGVVVAWSIRSIGLGWRFPTSARELLVYGFVIAMVYATWRSALRARRASNAMPAAERSPSRDDGFSPRRLAASLALAIVVMLVTFGASFAIADSGGWGGDQGLLSQSLLWIGHGIPLAAFKLHLARLSLTEMPGAEFLQCVLLTTIFYLLGSRWARRGHRIRAESDAEAGSPREDRR